MRNAFAKWLLQKTISKILKIYSWLFLKFFGPLTNLHAMHYQIVFAKIIFQPLRSLKFQGILGLKSFYSLSAVLTKTGNIKLQKPNPERTSKTIYSWLFLLKNFFGPLTNLHATHNKCLRSRGVLFFDSGTDWKSQSHDNLFLSGF